MRHSALSAALTLAPAGPEQVSTLGWKLRASCPRLWLTRPRPPLATLSRDGNEGQRRFHISQSRKRPPLGPSPCWKCQLELPSIQTLLKGPSNSPWSWNFRLRKGSFPAVTLSQPSLARSQVSRLFTCNPASSPAPAPPRAPPRVTYHPGGTTLLRLLRDLFL